MDENMRSRAKKRRNFDDIFAEKSAEIDKMSLKELRDHRKYLTSWKTNIEELRKEDGIARGRFLYLSGLRNVAINLLKYSKDRIKMINVVINNGTTISHAKRFVKIAADTLPLGIFQTIYGLSLCQEEKDQTAIESVKAFMEESENLAYPEPNGNVLQETINE
jgi:S-adenosylmethionine hydrolase